jgi:predicted acyl esterase
MALASPAENRNTVCACWLVFVGTLLGMAQAHAAPAESQSSATTVNYQRQFGYLPLKDGVRLAYVVWLPKRQGAIPP